VAARCFLVKYIAEEHLACTKHFSTQIAKKHLMVAKCSFAIYDVKKYLMATKRL